MEQFDPTAPYEARRDFYRQLTKDPEFLSLAPEDRQDVAKKILFPGERPVIGPPGEKEPTLVGRKIAAGAERILGGIAKAAPFPGVIKALTAPETVPEEQRNLGYLVNPIPEAVSDIFQRGVENVRSAFGHEPAKLIEDIGGAAPHSQSDCADYFPLGEWSTQSALRCDHGLTERKTKERR